MEDAANPPEAASACVGRVRTTNPALLVHRHADSQRPSTPARPPPAREAEQPPNCPTQESESDGDRAKEEEIDKDDHEAVVRRDVERDEPFRDPGMHDAERVLLLLDDRDWHRRRCLRPYRGLPLFEVWYEGGGRHERPCREIRRARGRGRTGQDDTIDERRQKRRSHCVRSRFQFDSVRENAAEGLGTANEAARSRKASQVSAGTVPELVDCVDDRRLADESERPGIVARPGSVHVRVLDRKEAGSGDELEQREDEEQSLFSPAEGGPCSVGGQRRGRSNEGRGGIGECADEEPKGREKDADQDESTEDPADPAVPYGQPVREIDSETGRFRVVGDSK